MQTAMLTIVDDSKVEDLLSLLRGLNYVRVTTYNNASSSNTYQKSFDYFKDEDEVLDWCEEMAEECWGDE
jgi:hypothetical protein